MQGFPFQMGLVWKKNWKGEEISKKLVKVTYFILSLAGRQRKSSVTFEKERPEYNFTLLWSCTVNAEVLGSYAIEVLNLYQVCLQLQGLFV